MIKLTMSSTEIYILKYIMNIKFKEIFDAKNGHPVCCVTASKLMYMCYTLPKAAEHDILLSK